MINAFLKITLTGLIILSAIVMASIVMASIVFAQQSLNHALQPLNVVSWGGAYTMSQEEAYSKPWTEKTGQRIVNIDHSASALEGLRSQVEAGNVTWDLVDMLPADATIACAEGLIEILDHNAILSPAPDGSPPSEDFIPGALGECFVATIVYSNIVAFNTQMFSEDNQPSTIVDVFDLENFPGARSLQRRPSNNLEWALIADGVPLAEVYPTLRTKKGVERALSKLDSIKDSIIWWSEGAHPPQLLADNEVVFASAYNGRIFDAQINDNQPFGIIWDAQVFELDGWVIPIGKMDVAKDFLRFSTNTDQNAAQARYISYGPTRLSAIAIVENHIPTGIDMTPHMPTYALNFSSALSRDEEFWVDYQDELNEQFDAWLAR